MSRPIPPLKGVIANTMLLVCVSDRNVLPLILVIVVVVVVVVCYCFLTIIIDGPPEDRSLPFLLLLHHVLLCYALNPPFYLTKPLGAKTASFVVGPPGTTVSRF